ncbi:hypothetical protein NH340_JMT04166 [Sarcoptes scabiei]|nr:hypothetical protein NH340_JMT04166 [Sarcoptes scabiei]
MGSNLHLEKLIETLTSGGTEELKNDDNLRLFTDLYKMKRDNDDSIGYIFRLLQHRLREKHAQIRFGTLLLIDYLFVRCIRFRRIILENMMHIIRYCLGLEFDCQINDKQDYLEACKNSKLLPKVWAQKLRNKFLTRFESWHKRLKKDNMNDIEKYYKFFIRKNLFKLIATSSSSTSSSSSKSIVKQKPLSESEINSLNKNFESLERRINNLTIEIDSCFEQLLPEMKLLESKDSNVIDVNYRPMQGLSFNIILVSTIELVRDDQNADLIAKLNDLCLRLKIEEKKLEKFEIGTIQLKTRFHRQIQTLRMRISTILSKQKDIKIIDRKEKNTEASDDSSDDFEEVMESEEQFLMTKIEAEKSSHPKDLQSTSSLSKCEDVDNRCKALLPSGRLCPRRDKRKCPFHGIIIPRDDQGLPIDEEMRQKELINRKEKEMNEWKDPNYLKMLSKKIGQNLELQNRRQKSKSKDLNLIDLKHLKSTPKQRLSTKVLKIFKNASKNS